MRIVVFVSLFLCARCCLDGWIQHESSCYHFSHDLEPWTGAAYMCKTMGGKLVEIESAAENAYLSNVVDALKHNFWIGLSDVQEEGVWVWMDSKAKLSTTGFSRWNPGQPSNDGNNENCATMQSNTGGKWNDWHCDGSIYYICEQESKSLPLSNGWIRHGNSCYFFSHDKETFLDASYMCRHMGGELVEIDSSYENSYLNTRAPYSIYPDETAHLSHAGRKRTLLVFSWGGSNEEPTTTISDGNFWIGLNDIQEQRIYRWFGSNRKAGYTNWDHGQPQNNGEYCGVLSHEHRGKWHDYTCSNFMQYICEK